jgi:thiamine-phosphate diphosphorylase
LTKREALAAALRTPYVITDPTLPPRRGHLQIARAALAGGARILQLREKNLPREVQTAIASEMAALAHAAGGLLIVNDYVDVAWDADGDGVHLGRSDTPVRLARAELGADAIIGATVDTVEEARAAADDGADYLGVGPIFATSTKPNAGKPVGVEHIALMRSAAAIPVVAIGGLTADNVSQALAAGAAGAAFISAVVCADDAAGATQKIATVMARFWKDAGL